MDFYLVLKANFNYKFMFSKLNIQFIELYSISFGTNLIIWQTNIEKVKQAPTEIREHCSQNT